MAKVLRCADVTGDCPAVVRGETVGEILEQVGLHVRHQHGLQTVPPELVLRAREAIRDE